MAIQIPEYLQTKTYSAKKDRRLQQAEVMQEGIVDFGHFKVTQRGAGANMSVDVAAGEAWVDGDSSVEQGYYHVVNDAVVNVAISAASAVNPRIDTLVLAVNDSTEIGGSDEYKLEVIAGTVTAAASLANLSGVAAVGNTKLVLAYILVGKEVTSITTEKIGGKRDYREGLTGYPAAAEPKAVTGAPPQYAHGRPLSYVPACHAYHNTSQSIVAKAPHLFNSEVFDNEEIHSVAENTGRFTVKTPGLYMITYSAFLATGGLVVIAKNATTGTEAFEASHLLAHESFVANSYVTFAAIGRLGFGDFVTLNPEAANNTGSNIGTALDSGKIIWQGP
jgi:hypothetical protein